MPKSIYLDKLYDWLEFQASVAVLSHAMLFIASLFASPVGAGVTEATVCQSIPSAHQARHLDGGWTPIRHEVSVRSFGAVQRRGQATLRVLGRCVVKAGTEHARPVLFGSAVLQLDDPDDENLAGAWTHAKAPIPRPTAVGISPTALYVARAPVTQLERPPRV